MCLRSLHANPVGGHIRFSTADSTKIESNPDVLMQTLRGQLLLKDVDKLAEAGNDAETLGAVIAALPFNVNEAPATLTACGLMEGISENTTLGSELPWLFQMNSVFLEPPSSEVLTKKGDRLWFLCRCSDVSGSTTLGVSEAAALQLSGCATKEKFLQATKDKDLQFPLLCSVRVVRTVRNLGDERVINCVVVAASHVRLADYRANQAMDDVVRMLRQCGPSTDALLPAKLSELSKSHHYGFQAGFG